ILSFQALRGREAPLEIVLVVDDVKTGLEIISYERSQIDKFLRTDGGRLDPPSPWATLPIPAFKFRTTSRAMATPSAPSWISTPSAYIRFFAPEASTARSNAFSFPSLRCCNLRQARLPAR